MEILSDPEFASGDYYTNYMEKREKARNKEVS